MDVSASLLFQIPPTLTVKTQSEGGGTQTAKQQNARQPFVATAEAALAAEEQAWSGSSAQLKAFLLRVEWVWICLVQTVFVFQAPTSAWELARYPGSGYIFGQIRLTAMSASAEVQTVVCSFNMYFSTLHHT